MLYLSQIYLVVIIYIIKTKKEVFLCVVVIVDKVVIHKTIADVIATVILIYMLIFVILPENYLYGHAYTPNQTMNKTFEPEIGLNNGTIFPELVSPYYPGQSIDFINYLKNGGCDHE